MPAYRMVKTRIHQPTSEPVPGSPMQGEWVDTDGIRVLDCWGQLHPLEAELVTTPLGQAGRQRCFWRGQLPDRVQPGPGWTVEVGEGRYRAIKTAWSMGLWRLDLEQID